MKENVQIIFQRALKNALTTRGNILTARAVGNTQNGLWLFSPSCSLTFLTIQNVLSYVGDVDSSYTLQGLQCILENFNFSYNVSLFPKEIMFDVNMYLFYSPPPPPFFFDGRINFFSVSANNRRFKND